MPLSNNSSASPPSDSIPNPIKRKSITGANATANTNGRAVKRRASKACQCCRARKVRCNVVEHGAPCTNCRLDEVECIVTESRRRKKHNFTAPNALNAISEHAQSHSHSNSLHHHPHARALSGAEALASGNVNPMDINNPAFRRASASTNSMDDDDDDILVPSNHGVNGQRHVPHSLYAKIAQGQGNTGWGDPNPPQLIHALVNTVSIHGDLVSSSLQTPAQASPSGTIRSPVPAYIKQLPPRMTAEDTHYLWKKGALSTPDKPFRNALLRAYIEYVHPYMPLIELHDFLDIVHRGDGTRSDGTQGKVSMVLFQAVMFTGTAFVDKSWLEGAGYGSRKAARKAFYLKARLLYDFDYEIDRVALVQSLLLMTYWYETPDDQKDTWHWMGVAISLAHTIGLHRNPEKSHMDIKKQKLWKRIWWSCFMRDRLVALGMRRPTRIKDGDYDVPMLTLDDFEIESLAHENTTIPADCVLIRDLQMQRDLALLCIAKAKLSLIISHVLGAQYSVLVRDQGMAQGQEGNTRSSVMLFPKKHDQTEEVKSCDAELDQWVSEVPPEYAYHTPTMAEVHAGNSSLVVQRALLHMVYYATVSALHRPQVLPSAETSSLQKCRDLQDMSRKKVREASRAITTMNIDLHNLCLERYLPTTGVTVLLPAIIIHLLDIKSHSDATRDAALTGFFQCMQVLTSLRDNYAAAEFATQFLEAAIKKADIDVGRYGELVRSSSRSSMDFTPNAKLRTMGMLSRPHTPPPDYALSRNGNMNGHMAKKRSYYSSPLDDSMSFPATTPKILSSHASTPPNSDSQSQNNSENPTHPHLPNSDDSATLPMMNGNAIDYGESHFEQNFDELIDYPGMDSLGGDSSLAMPMLGFEGGFGGGFGDISVGVAGAQGAHGESGGWMDLDWMEEGDGQWSPNVKGEREGAVDHDVGDGEMDVDVQTDGKMVEVLGKEESAIFLLQGA